MVDARDAVWVDVLPSMKRFGPELNKGLSAQAAVSGKLVGDQIGEGASKTADKHGQDTGKKFGRAVLAGAAVVASGAVLASKALYSIGETFDDVADTIRVGTGATGEALDSLIQSAKNVGKQVPAEFSEIGTVVADLNTRMGLSGEILETVASQYLEAGRILGEDVDVTKTSAAFNVFKIEGEGVIDAMDHLFRVSQATGVSINDLASNVQRSAPAVQALGFSFEETVSLIGNLDKAGLESRRMLMGLSGALVRLAEDGEAPQDAFRRVVGEIQGFIEKGDQAAALDLAGEIFGTRGATQFIKAIEDGTLALDDLSSVAGMTEDTILGAGKETMDFAEQWQLFKNQMLVYIAPAAEKVFGAIGEGMAWITERGVPALQSFIGWLDRNRTALVVLGVAVTALTAVMATHAAVVAVQGAGGIAKWIAQTRIAQAASTAWTAAQWALNAAMSANPIALVVLAIAGLVAAVVIAYQKSETFRTIVQAAWQGIQDAVSFAWERVIKPVFNGLVSFIDKVIIPAINWLWRNVVQPAWKGISTAVEVAWAIIRIIFDAFKWYINNVVAPVVTWLWEKVIKPAWDNISSAISWAWDNVIQPVFKALGDFIRDKVAPAFEKGIDTIKAAWEGIQEFARKPINFVIETVYMNGIKKVFDKIADAVGSDVRLPVVRPIGPPPAQSTRTGSAGGRGNYVARARGGWTRPGLTLVGEEGPEFVDFATPGRVYTAKQTQAFLHGTLPNGDGYGGPVDFLGNVWDWVVGNLRRAAAGALGRVTAAMESGIGGGLLGGLASGALKKVMDLVLGFAQKKDETEGTTYGGGGGFVPGRGRGSAETLLAFGRLMQSMGARVGEHPAFGGVRGAHMRGSKHYSGRALDINYGPGGENSIEKAFFDRVMRQGLPQSHGLRTLWRTPGHFDHMHVEYDKGGWLKPGITSVVNNTGRPEAVLTNRDSKALQRLARQGGPTRQTIIERLEVRDERAIREELDRRDWEDTVAEGVGPL